MLRGRQNLGKLPKIYFGGAGPRAGNLVRQAARRPENVGHAGAGARQPTAADPPHPSIPVDSQKSESENFGRVWNTRNPEKNLVFFSRDKRV